MENDDWIDNQGYRANIGIIVCNRYGQLLWARRILQQTWQFCQGGMQIGESFETAMFRELKEELGLDQSDVEILALSKNWLRYTFPEKYIRKNASKRCIGQKQKWFLLQLKEGCEKNIRFDSAVPAEFDYWRWVSYWYPLRNIVVFKKDVYRKVLIEFLPVIANLVHKKRRYKKTKYIKKQN